MPQSGMDVHHKQRPTVETVAKVVGHGYPRGRKRGIARAIGPANALLTSLSGLTNNWLRVLGTTERSQVDQRVCHQLHAIMPLLDAFKSQKQPLELVFPGKGPFDTHPQRMDGFVEEAFASALGRLSVAGILGDVGDQVVSLNCRDEIHPNVGTGTQWRTMDPGMLRKRDRAAMP